MPRLDRKLKFAVWRRGDKTLLYGLCQSEEMAYERSLWALMGVTRRISSLVPALLYRTQHGGPQENCSPHFLGVSFFCGSATSGGATCTRVLMECGRAETQDVLVIDDASGIIRRHESMSISRPSPAWQLPNSVSENVVTYDSEFDIADATSMIKELEKQPW
jgi:hypothetical protein